jgi:hypothetical protein
MSGLRYWQIDRGCVADGDGPHTETTSALPLTHSDIPADGIPRIGFRDGPVWSVATAATPALPSIRSCRLGSLQT